MWSPLRQRPEKEESIKNRHLYILPPPPRKPEFKRLSEIFSDLEKYDNRNDKEMCSGLSTTLIAILKKYYDAIQNENK